MENKFYLNPNVTFLNHGSFGACPKPVIKEYQQWQIKLEQQPVEFLGRRHGKLLLESRKALCNYLSCDTDELIFVPNATTAMNIVSHSLHLSGGDEVLSTDLEYGAMNRMWQLVCKEKNAKFVAAKVSLPLKSAANFTEDIWKLVNAKTKVIFLSHITSATALLLPIKQVINKARKKGIITVIDGAHVPGQIPLNLNELGADFYTGNCHKWLMSPKGSAFFYARKNKQSLLKPFLISWGRDEFLSNSAFIDEYEYQGTRDIAAFLSVPAAIEFHDKHVTKAFKDKTHLWLKYVKKHLEEILQTQPIIDTIPDHMQMYAHPLNSQINGKELKEQLYEKFKIEIPVSTQNKVEYIRISLQIYNTRKDLDFFLQSLKKLV